MPDSTTDPSSCLTAERERAARRFNQFTLLADEPCDFLSLLMPGESPFAAAGVPDARAPAAAGIGPDA